MQRWPSNWMTRPLPPLTPTFAAPLAVPLLGLVVASVLAATPARAQPPPSEVQPVPYTQSQPVPYAAPPPPPVQVAPPAPPQTAQTVGGDVVTLRGGELIRGALVESLPNDHVTMQLATGQLALIPWERIERIERAPAPQGPNPTPSHATSEAPVVAEEAWVHVESERPVTLQRRSTDDPGEWVAVCSAPCDMALALHDEYRIKGRAIRSSRPFHLEARPGERLEIRVNGGAIGGLVGGIILVTTGPVVGLVGVGLLIVASAESSSSGVSSNPSDGGSSARDVGVVLAAGGLLMTVGGIVMLANNARTHVSQDQFQPNPPSNDAWRRRPTWREDRIGAALPQTTEVPLFHTSF